MKNLNLLCFLLLTAGSYGDAADCVATIEIEAELDKVIEASSAYVFDDS